MGRVRFYTQDGEQYCTLRVEEDGLYLLGDKVRMHKERAKMPPKRQPAVAATQESSAYATGFSTETLLAKILAVFDDMEQTFRHDPKGMATLKPAYKKSGTQIGLSYLGEWSNFDGQNILEAVLAYHASVCE
jgi:hypothetical protein